MSDNVTINCWWSHKYISWRTQKAISNSLYISFIHNHIRGWSCKKPRSCAEPLVDLHVSHIIGLFCLQGGRRRVSEPMESNEEEEPTAGRGLPVKCAGNGIIPAVWRPKGGGATGRASPAGKANGVKGRRSPATKAGKVTKAKGRRPGGPFH